MIGNQKMNEDGSIDGVPVIEDVGRFGPAPKLPGTLKPAETAPEEARHENDVVTLLYHNDLLYSGADDGKIKVWNSDLSPVASWQAHPVNVYSLAILDDKLYSSSNDGTLKSWEIGTWKLLETIIEKSEADIIKVYTDNGRMYAGNEQGEVFVFEDDKQIASYSLQEDIQDFLVIGQLVFNARNVDVSVTEMMPAPRYSYMSRGVMIGRFPIRKIGNKVLFLSRCARNIYVHASTKEEMFKRLAEIKAHDMTISAMCGMSQNENLLVSGGYDRILKVWDLSSLKVLAKLDVGLCINDLCVGPPGSIYLSSCEGYIGRFEFTMTA